MSLQAALESVLNDIKPFKACKLIAVTKTHSAEMIRALYDLGFKTYGENKVQELVEKQNVLPNDIEWHLIGHLQRNKVKYIAQFVSCIHSVDSYDLLVEINKQAQKHQRIIPCLLQIHIAQEETKFGLDASEAISLLEAISLQQLKHVRIVGLMGMASFTDNQQQIRTEFQTLKTHFDDWKKYNHGNIDLKELSMGMSGDYLLAAELGSTYVRVGSKIFGSRNYAV